MSLNSVTSAGENRSEEYFVVRFITNRISSLINESDKIFGSYRIDTSSSHLSSYLTIQTPIRLNAVKIRPIVLPNSIIQIHIIIFCNVYSELIYVIIQGR